jgi:hypothetical protein
VYRLYLLDDALEQEDDALEQEDDALARRNAAQKT